jgi:hypothetical protein
MKTNVSGQYLTGIYNFKELRRDWQTRATLLQIIPIRVDCHLYEEYGIGSYQKHA